MCEECVGFLIRQVVCKAAPDFVFLNPQIPFVPHPRKLGSLVVENTRNNKKHVTHTHTQNIIKFKCIERSRVYDISVKYEI